MAKCACGCGKEAGIAKASNSHAGIVRGNPNRYARGHNANTRPPLDTTVEHPLCACGCRKPVPRRTRDRKSHGWTKGDFCKFLVGHAAKKSKVVFTIEWRGYVSACWIWQMAREVHGYGVKQGKDGSHLAHKYYWQAVNGPVPKGLELDHLCSNKSCMRPDHLEPVTRRENILRAFARRRERNVQHA